MPVHSASKFNSKYARSFALVASQAGPESFIELDYDAGNILLAMPELDRDAFTYAFLGVVDGYTEIHNKTILRYSSAQHGIHTASQLGNLQKDLQSGLCVLSLDAADGSIVRTVAVLVLRILNGPSECFYNIAWSGEEGFVPRVELPEQKLGTDGSAMTVATQIWNRKFKGIFTHAVQTHQYVEAHKKKSQNTGIMTKYVKHVICISVEMDGDDAFESTPTECTWNSDGSSHGCSDTPVRPGRNVDTILATLSVRRVRNELYAWLRQEDAEVLQSQPSMEKLQLWLDEYQQTQHGETDVLGGVTVDRVSC